MGKGVELCFVKKTKSVRKKKKMRKTAVRESKDDKKKKLDLGADALWHTN